MIVVILVGISAAMIAPAMTRAMAINRTNRCQYDAARLFRSARASAIGTGRAHLVNRTGAAGGVALEVFIGDSSSCARSRWDAIVVPGNPPVDGFYEETYTASGHGVLVRYLTPASGAAIPTQVCFDPQGERHQRASVGGPFVRARETLTFAIDRLENGAPAGDPQRAILLPQFGTPRVLR